MREGAKEERDTCNSRPNHQHSVWSTRAEIEESWDHDLPTLQHEMKFRHGSLSRGETDSRFERVDRSHDLSSYVDEPRSPMKVRRSVRYVVEFHFANDSRWFNIDFVRRETDWASDICESSNAISYWHWLEESTREDSHIEAITSEA